MQSVTKTTRSVGTHWLAIDYHGHCRIILQVWQPIALSWTALGSVRMRKRPTGSHRKVKICSNCASASAGFQKIATYATPGERPPASLPSSRETSDQYGEEMDEALVGPVYLRLSSALTSPLRHQSRELPLQPCYVCTAHMLPATTTYSQL